MVDYNPFSEEVMRDPHPIYRQLRKESPVHHIEEYDAWALAKFEDIWKCSMDNRHFSAARGTTSSHLLTKVQPVTPMLNNMDPPQHTQLRAAMRHHFTPAAINKMEPVIREIAAKNLEEARDRGELNVMGDLASKVSVTVACLVVGIPLEDSALMNDLVWRFFARDPEIDGMTPDGLEAMEEMFVYFTEISHKRRKQGDQGDVVSLLNDIEIDGQKLDDAAIASHISMLIIGGSETLPKVFASAVQHLANHPDQRAEVAKDLALVPNAFLETLRYDMPTQFLCRTVIDDVEVGGKRLSAGQPVLFLYPSGNRDEDEFQNPDAFDVRREIPRLLSFGHGTHLCLGIHAAKLEGRVLLEELLPRFPEYALDLDRSERLVTDFVQGWGKLHITF
ncbi:MAG: cytochrome P450 [Myxococcota bacterium]|nr:cytochrome P450 [Myxococcota bacterium]